MRNFLFIIIIAGLAFAVSCTNAVPALRVENTAPAKSQPAQADHADDALRITLADAKKEYDAGAAVMIDVRAEAAYKAEHIKGAINITPEMLEAKYKGLPKDKKLIVYCS